MPEGLHPLGPSRRQHHTVDEIPQKIRDDAGNDATENHTARVYLCHPTSLKNAKVPTTVISRFSDVSPVFWILSVGLCRWWAKNRPEEKECQATTIADGSLEVPLHWIYFNVAMSPQLPRGPSLVQQKSE